MDIVFKILDENNEIQKDDFELKVNPFRFEFKAQDEDARKNAEIRFKRDRGLNEKVQKELLKIKVKMNLQKKMKIKLMKNF